MIPGGKTIEDIKAREAIIRDYYREWKTKNPSQRKFNLSLKEYINIRMVSIVETSEHAAKSYLYEKKASEDAFVFAPECVWEVYAISVMLCGRGLRTTHIHRPHTTCFQMQKYNNSFSLQYPL